MSERITSKPWTEEEDLLLRQAVAEHGEIDNWKTVALSIPGRTNKACRKRWLHSLQPNVKKTAWTPQEDQLLLNLFASLGPKWSAIARQIPGRTDDACSKRYREALDPRLKKDQWTDEEDALLMKAFHNIGQKWGQIGQELQRSGLACRNRWRLLERKKDSRLYQITASHAISAQEIPVIEHPTQSILLQEEVPHASWPPPYYPPEAYPTSFADEGQPSESSFREPSPAILPISNPYVAPFQFSSSSLSAALSDPPRPPAPLPPLSTFNTPELLLHDIPNDTERQPSLSPLSQCNAIPEMSDDTLMSLEGHTQGAMEHGSQISVPQLPFTPDTFSNLRQLSDCIIYTPSPYMVSSDILRNQDSFYIWRPRGIPDNEYDSPRSTFNGSILYEVHDDYSSASSTPYVFSPSSLSPGPSPLPATLLDLPNTEQPSSSSLLFAPPNEFRPPSIRRPRKHASRKAKPTLKAPVPTRLSSILPLSSDPNVRPYACGRPQCWPSTATTSSSCFATSGELLDHSKDQHPDEEVSEKPFRCALAGCEKSWKSINGLQYHLQISTAHFSSALTSRLTAQMPITPDLNTPSSMDGEIEDSEPERKYACPRHGCYKAYRQPSGLRYHIKYGHPTDIPTQLAVVPPALERQIPNKAKKLRPKPLPEPVAS